MSAPILTEEEIREAANGYSAREQNESTAPWSESDTEACTSDFSVGAHFALAAAENRMARDTEIRAQLAERIYALLDDYGGAMTRTEKAYYEAVLAAAKGES